MNFAEWLSQNFVSILTLLITVVGTPTLAWFFSRQRLMAETRKINAEGTSILVTSSGNLVSAWKEFADEMEAKYDDTKKQNDELLRINHNLLQSNSYLASRIEKLELNMKVYMSGIEQLFEILVIEIEKTKPELAKHSREKFSEVSRIFDKLE